MALECSYNWKGKTLYQSKWCNCRFKLAKQRTSFQLFIVMRSVCGCLKLTFSSMWRQVIHCIVGLKEEDVYWTGQSGKMVFIIILVTPDNGKSPRRRRNLYCWCLECNIASYYIVWPVEVWEYSAMYCINKVKWRACVSRYGVVYYLFILQSGLTWWPHNIYLDNQWAVDSCYKSKVEKMQEHNSIASPLPRGGRGLRRYGFFFIESMHEDGCYI